MKWPFQEIEIKSPPLFLAPPPPPRPEIIRMHKLVNYIEETFEDTSIRNQMIDILIKYLEQIKAK